MLEITEVIRAFRTLTREQFLATRPEPVLLHRTNTGDPKGKQGFAAGVDDFDDAAPTDVVESPLDIIDTARSASGVLVFPVKMRRPAGSISRVIVGRDKEADVQLPYMRVSKLHAYFSADSRRDRWHLTDIGSTNGTWLFGEQLPHEEPTLVPSGVDIRFGTAEFSFHRAVDFYDYLTRLLARASGG